MHINRGWCWRSRARTVRNKEGQQLKCAKQLHRGLGAQNGNFYVTYFLKNHNRSFVYYLTYFYIRFIM